MARVPPACRHFSERFPRSPRRPASRVARPHRALRTDEALRQIDPPALLEIGQEHRQDLLERPRVNLTRFRGVFAPHSRHRARVTPAGRGPDAKRVAAESEHPKTSTEPEQRTEHASVGWAQRLRRVFGIDIERCAACGGTLRIIACMEDRAVIGECLRRARVTGQRDYAGAFLLASLAAAA